MAAPDEDEWLSDKVQVVVILRLLLDAHRTLERGEIVDLQGASHGRFKDWSGLTHALVAWLGEADRTHE